MKLVLVLFLLLHVWILVVSALNSDGLTLLSLRRRWTSVPPSIALGWNDSDSNPCSWKGIQCNNRTHNVISLNLSGYAISGQLGPEIAHLAHLQTLNLSKNNFSGVIPLELSNCTLLESLDLSDNDFTREIPRSLKNLQNLKVLRFDSNSLSGEIPDGLFEIPHLETIYLNHNNFNGSIPSNIGNLTNVSKLWLNNNLLSGTIPHSITNCQKLGSLDLSYNAFSGGLPPGVGNCSSLYELAIVHSNLTGNIPSSFGLLDKLSHLDLSENRLSGRIPPELGNCKSLTELMLYTNQLEGEIPIELGMLSELQNLQLFENRLTGEIPISIWKIQSLRYVHLYNNSLSGKLPLELTHLKHLKMISLFTNKFFGVIPQSLGVNSSLELLDLMYNQFTSQIPPNLCFRKRLRVLNLGNNHFHGRIPSDVGKCPTLQRMRLEHNNLLGVLPEFLDNPNLAYINMTGNNISGKIPSSLGNCTNLTSIDLSMNKLGGSIPPELGNLVNLTRLSLAHNHLQGCLPPHLSTWKKLDTFDVGFNSLNCSIPSSLGNLTSLSTLVLEENRFTGGIPPFLSKLDRLSLLRMGGNLLAGEIPSSIGTLKNLRYGLDLRSNGLIGHIPRELGYLSSLQSLDISSNSLTGSLDVLNGMQALLEVNISYNGFTGSIPEKLMVLAKRYPSSFLGNPGLCVNCPLSDGLNCVGNSNFRPCAGSSSGGKKLNKSEIAMMALGLSLGVFLLLGFACVFLLCRRKQHEVLGREPMDDDEPLLNQIMEATENLNDRYIVGKGAHGAVFKAELGPTNVFAVKKLQFSDHEDGSRSMIREIQIIENARHRNLVKVEDYWFRKDYGLILYRYMENGNLHDVLYATNQQRKLEWSVRYKISVGTAHGLAYLHHDCDPPILHRDIKPQNILLDSEMEPRISDFGIAKLLDQSSASGTSISVSGTLGYIAPENAYMTVRGKESDVYSYGVVLLELMTKRKPSDSSFMEEVDIVGWVRSIWSETQDISAIVDSSLMEETVDSNIAEQIIGVLLIALRCTEKEPSSRPTMRDVVKQLQDVNPPQNSRYSKV
ncbi:hypothetical protein P3X46_001105 [Hevea brasiliensis]|uniref:Protein kinase domain-containing protein n=1 Tax=Hevea brasiliensis TaxID=3981 RepID=A0ABQ9NC70_HEVBR|nr:receptor-like protein kinase isoform X1 [Hevea brasiliensis]KAJ9189854.1 hypothetical protein P3X46_001105 [Hevea brasiliensis]